eukprot:COSAG02_NODE_418_length_22698_cov_7.471127_11_plen_84_part_00
MIAQKSPQLDTEHGYARNLHSCVGSASNSGGQHYYVRIVSLVAQQIERAAERYMQWGAGTNDPWDIAHARGLAEIMAASESMA